MLQGTAPAATKSRQTSQPLGSGLAAVARTIPEIIATEKYQIDAAVWTSRTSRVGISPGCTSTNPTKGGRAMTR